MFIVKAFQFNEHVQQYSRSSGTTRRTWTPCLGEASAIAQLLQIYPQAGPGQQFKVLSYLKIGQRRWFSRERYFSITPDGSLRLDRVAGR